MEIKNRKAYFNFEILEEYVTGIMLSGPEVKSLRTNSSCDIKDAYCIIHKNELFVEGVYIAVYEQGSTVDQVPKRRRKLLATRREIEKMRSALETRGLALPVLRLFMNDRGLVKIVIGVARGKKTHDKKNSIKDKDMKRQIEKEHSIIYK